MTRAPRERRYDAPLRRVRRHQSQHRNGAVFRRNADPRLADSKTTRRRRGQERNRSRARRRSLARRKTRRRTPSRVRFGTPSARKHAAAVFTAISSASRNTHAPSSQSTSASASEPASRLRAQITAVWKYASALDANANRLDRTNDPIAWRKRSVLVRAGETKVSRVSRVSKTSSSRRTFRSTSKGVVLLDEPARAPRRNASHVSNASTSIIPSPFRSSASKMRACAAVNPARAFMATAIHVPASRRSFAARREDPLGAELLRPLAAHLVSCRCLYVSKITDVHRLMPSHTPSTMKETKKHAVTGLCTPLTRVATNPRAGFTTPGSSPRSEARSYTGRALSNCTSSTSSTSYALVSCTPSRHARISTPISRTVLRSRESVGRGNQPPSAGSARSPAKDEHSSGAIEATRDGTRNA